MRATAANATFEFYYVAAQEFGRGHAEQVAAPDTGTEGTHGTHRAEHEPEHDRENSIEPERHVPAAAAAREFPRGDLELSAPCRVVADERVMYVMRDEDLLEAPQGDNRNEPTPEPEPDPIAREPFVDG